MKKALALFLLLLSSFALCSWKDENWQEACYEGEGYGNIAIYNQTAKLWSLDISLLEAKFEILGSKAMDFLSNYSEATVSGVAYPLIPEASGTQSGLYSTNKNYTIFIPLASGVSPEGKISIRIVGNTTDGCPICGIKDFNVPSFESVDTLDVNVSVDFNSTIHKFQVNISTSEDYSKNSPKFIVGVVESESKKVVVLSQYLFAVNNGYKVFTIPVNFSSEDVANGKYEVYVIGMREEPNFARFAKYFSAFSFSDFEIKVSNLPKVYPGNSYKVRFSVRNVGTNAGNYEISLVKSDVESVGINPTSFSLVQGENKSIEVSFNVPQSHQGPVSIVLSLYDYSSGLSKLVNLTFLPFPKVTLETLLVSPKKIRSYSNNPIELHVYGKGTIKPKVFWVAYTEPALLVSKGYGEGVVGEIGNVSRLKGNLSVEGACAFSQEDSTAFDAGRRVLVLAKAAYYLSSNMNNDTKILLQNVSLKIDSEKLKITSEEASRLYDMCYVIEQDISDIIDAYEYGNEFQLSSKREDLYLDIIDFEQALVDSGEKMMEKCSKVDSLDFYVYIYIPETNQEKLVKEENIPVEGASVIDLIGPKEVKAIAGEPTEIEYTVKNNADRDFYVDFESSSDIVSVIPSFVHIDPGASKKIKVKFFPPKYIEEKEKITITLKTESYELDFPLEVEIGRFKPEIKAETKEIYVTPGKESYENITIYTGGLDDSFKVFLDCPLWVSAPEKVITKNKTANIELYLAPPANLKGKDYYCEIEIVSENFPGFKDRKTFTIIATRIKEELISRLESDRRILESLKDNLKSVEYNEMVRSLEEAKGYIEEGRYTKAKVELKKIEEKIETIEKANESKRKGPNIFLILFILSLVGFSAYKFVLPKLVTKQKPQQFQQFQFMGAGKWK